MPRPIDADKVAEAIEWLDEYDFVIWHDVMECIDKLPTVDAEPVRHGHWINHFDDLFPEESTQECSVCHAEQMGTMLNDNYCPNCGAKMDESTMGQVKPSDKEFTLYADDKPIVTFKASQIVLHGERKEDAEH